VLFKLRREGDCVVQVEEEGKDIRQRKRRNGGRIAF